MRHRGEGHSMGGHFHCSQCGLEAPYDYFGRKPPYAPKIVFLEDAFVCRDPFTERERALFLGGRCCVCGEQVCPASSCSLFYTKRFCMPCAQKNRQAFPPEVCKDIISPYVQTNMEAKNVN